MDGAAVESAEAKASVSQQDERRPGGDVVVLDDDHNDPQGLNVMTSTAVPVTEPSVDPSADCVSPIEEADGRRDGTVFAPGDDASPAPAPDAGDSNDHGRDEDATRIRRTVSDGDDPPVPPSHESDAVIDGEGQDGGAQKIVTEAQPTNTTTSGEEDSAAAVWLLSEATKADGDGDVKVPEPAQVESPDFSPSSDGCGEMAEVVASAAADDCLELRPLDNDHHDDEVPVDLDSAAIVKGKEEEVAEAAAEESAENLHDKSDLVVEDDVARPCVDERMVDAVASSEIRNAGDDTENEPLPSSDLKEEGAEGVAVGDDFQAAEETSSCAAATDAVTETARGDANADLLGGGGGEDDATAGDGDPAPLDKVESGTALDDSAVVDAAFTSPHEDSTLVETSGNVAPMAEAAGDSQTSPVDDVELGAVLDDAAVDATLSSPPEDSSLVESISNGARVDDATAGSDPSPLDAVEPGTCNDNSAAKAALSSPPKDSATIDSSTNFTPIDPEPSAANDNEAGGAEGASEPARSSIVADGEDLDAVPPTTPTPAPHDIDEAAVSDEIVETIDGPDVDDLDAPPENAALIVATGMPVTEGNDTIPIDEKATRKRPWEEEEVPPAAVGSSDGTDGLTPALAGTEATNPESPPETFKSKKPKKDKKQKKEKKRKKEKKKKKDKKKKSKGSSISSSEYDDTSCYDSTSCDDSEAQDSDAPLIPREVQSSTIQGSGVLLPPPTFDDSAEFEDLHDDRLLDAVPTPHSPERMAAPHSEMDSQKESVANETTDGADSQLGMCSTGNSDDAPDEAASVSTTSNEASTAILGNVDNAGSPLLEDSAVKTEEEAESLMTASAQVPVPVEVDSIQVDAPDEIVSLGREVPVIGAAADVSSNGNDSERNEKSADDLALESLESDVPSLTNIDTAKERSVEPAGELFGDAKGLEAVINSAEVILSDDATTSEPDCESSKAAELSTVNQLDHESDTAIIVEATGEKGSDDDSKNRNVVQSPLEKVDAESSTAHAPFPSAESEAALDGDSNAVLDQSRSIQNDAETQSAEDLAAGVESAELTSAPAEQVDSTCNDAEMRVSDNDDNHAVSSGATEPVAETDSAMCKVVDPFPLDPLDPDSNAAEAPAVDVVKGADPDYEISEGVELSNLNELDSGFDTADTLVSNVETAASRNDESSPVAEESALDQLDNDAEASLSIVEAAAGTDGVSGKPVEVSFLDQPDSESKVAEPFVTHYERAVGPDGERKPLVETSPQHSPPGSACGPLDATLPSVTASAEPDGEGSLDTGKVRVVHDVSKLDAPEQDRSMLLNSELGSRSLEIPSKAQGGTAEVTEDKELFIAKADKLDPVTDPASVEEVELIESSQHIKLQGSDHEATHLMDHDRERLETKDQPRTVDGAPEKPTMLVLVSNHALKREVVANQQMAFTVLSARKIRYETLDGSLIENQQRRNELFELSGLRGQYPQFFKLRQSETEDSDATFYGDWDQFQWANECGTLLQDFARSGDDELLIAGSDGGGPPPINKPGSDAEESAEAADNLVPNSVDSTVEAKDASQIGGDEELSEECAESPLDRLPQANAVVASAVLRDSMNQEIDEEPVRAGRRSPIPPKKAVHVPAAFLGPVATEGIKNEPKTLRSTSPIPPKRAVVVPAAFACLADQRAADEGSRLVANPSPKLTKKAVFVPTAFGGKNVVASFERTEERPRRTGRSSPIPPKKAVVVPAAFGGTNVQERASENETPESSQGSPVAPKKAVVVPAAFAGSKPKEATPVEGPERLVRRSPILSKKKALVVPAAFTNAGGQTSAARASPIPLKKSAAVLVSGSASSRTQPENGGVSKPIPTAGSRKVVVPGAFVGDSRVESRKPGITPSSSPSSEDHSGLQVVGKQKQSGTEAAASPTQVRRTLIFPDDGNLEYGVVESRSEPTPATQPSRKKLAIPGAFSNPDPKSQTSNVSPIKEIGSGKKQSKLSIPFSYSESKDLDQSGTSTQNPDLKLDSSSHRGSAHIRTDTKTKLSIPAAFGGGTKPSDFAVQNGEEFAMKSSSDHIASSFSSPSKKLAIPAAFGSSPASRSAQSMLSQSMHTSPTKKFPVPAVSAVRGSPATSSTSDGSDEGRTHREVATNSVPAPPTQTSKKKLQIPAAFGHQQSSSNPVPAVGATPPKVRLFGTAERDGDTPSLGAIGDVAAVQSTSPPKDSVAAAEPSPFRRKLAIPDAFGKTSSHDLSSSSHHSPPKPLRPSSASGLSSSSYHRASTTPPPQPTKILPSPGPSTTSGAASKIGNPRSSMSSTASKYVTVGDTVMTRAAAAAFAAHEDSLMMANDIDDTGDIPMRRRSQPGRRPSITSSSSSSPTPAAPKRKVAIPAAFLGGAASSQP